MGVIKNQPYCWIHGIVDQRLGDGIRVKERTRFRVTVSYS